MSRYEEEASVPHVNIKHFPVSLSEQQEAALLAEITAAVARGLSCDEGVISIALEPVPQEAWNERVYVPEIVARAHLLRKQPNYAMTSEGPS
jgi:phenylpyruvate tautomerase PptA (4-oxalocrotonate tautomerase family)